MRAGKFTSKVAGFVSAFLSLCVCVYGVISNVSSTPLINSTLPSPLLLLRLAQTDEVPPAVNKMTCVIYVLNKYIEKRLIMFENYDSDVKHKYFPVH